MKPYAIIGRDNDWLKHPTADDWGGKGWGLLKMAAEGLPVPPGFVIPVAVHKQYRKDPTAVLAALRQDIPKLLAIIEKAAGGPRLVSVRSGAPVSMPGMMDTLLNVGLTKSTIAWWSNKIGKDVVWDCRLRLVSQFAEIVGQLDKEVVHLAAKKSTSPSLAVSSVMKLMATADIKFPETIVDQVMAGIEAVFLSWNSERAKAYRKAHGIPDDMGTAVVVQAMVFGNLNEKSATGVLFTRDPSTGENSVKGDILVKAQGEDVVAGTHKPIGFKATIGPDGKVFDSSGFEELQAESGLIEPLLRIIEMSHGIETLRKDMQDVEFTIEDGKPWLLQTRTGKRSAKAAFVIADSMWRAGMIDEATVRKRVSLDLYRKASEPEIDYPNSKDITAFGGGIGASPGVVAGIACFTDADLTLHAGTGPLILIREQTTPDDFPLLVKADAVITTTGGYTCHAAVVARGMNKPAVVGFEHGKIENNELRIYDKDGTIRALDAGQWITVNGSVGTVWKGKAAIQTGECEEADRIVTRLARSDGRHLILGSNPMADGDYFTAETDDGVVALLARKQANKPFAVLDLRRKASDIRAQDVAFDEAILGTAQSAFKKGPMQWKAPMRSALAELCGWGVQVVVPEDTPAVVRNILSAAAVNCVVRECETLEELTHAEAGEAVTLAPSAMRVLGGLEMLKLVTSALPPGVTFIAQPLTPQEAASLVLETV